MKRVYFIKPIGFYGPIKIGCSISPDGRRKTLENWCPFPLEVLAEIEGDYDLEKRFHALFFDSHQGREWFAPTAELLSVIRAIQGGIFDLSTLPAPKSLLCGRAMPPPTVLSGLRRSATRRINKVQRLTGFCTPVESYEATTEEGFARIEAYLASPHTEGTALPYPWARERQTAWLASVQQEA